MIPSDSLSEKIKRHALSPSLFVLPYLVVFLLFLIHIIINLSVELKDPRGIASVLGFVNGFITLVIAQLLHRKIYIRWGSWCICSLLLLWFGTVFCLFELISPTNYIIGDVEFKSIFVKFGILIWLVGLSILLFLISKILSIDIITLKKPFKLDKQFKPFQIEKGKDKYIDEFGVSCIDTVFEMAHKVEKKIYFPILLMTDKILHPWRLARDFSLTGISKRNGVIFFTSSRPARLIYSKFLESCKNYPKQTDLKDLIKEYLIIIDTFSPLTDKQKAKIDCKVFLADPRNPYVLNKIYNKAIKFLKKEKKCKKVRVVYDSLSDFLFYTHMELAVPYLRHNMIWEEENNVSSLYIVWPDIAEKPIDDEYLKWFMNTLIIMKKNGKDITMKIEDLFPKEIKKFKVDNEFKLIEEFGK